jgi:hypothetical protein
VDLDSARAMSEALDRFFAHYYRRRPVSATFTGVHDFDARLPDWSPAGLQTLDDEMETLHTALRVAHPQPFSPGAYIDDPELLDAELARAFLEIQRAENASAHGVRGNPALWTSEAVMSIVVLMARNFAPVTDRLAVATARLDAIPDFLDCAYATLGDRPIPSAWATRALRECEGASILFGRGVSTWIEAAPNVSARVPALRAAAERASTAFAKFADWLSERPLAPHALMACGTTLVDLLLTRGHQTTRSRGKLLRDAREKFADARVRLDRMARELTGSWDGAQEQFAADHPPAREFLETFGRTWDACRDTTLAHELVTWPDWPLRYTWIPSCTREAAPYLYYLYYRSPAPFDAYDVYDYVVPSLPSSPGAADLHLRAWNNTVIKLNHVVHHGAIGHHVQNWHAYHRAPSRIGKIAAVDCASRIGMFGGGTMAEGWACYVGELMEEVGFLTPLERLSQQQSRVRFLARAIVDIELHQATMTFDDAVGFYTDQVGLTADAARAETVKNSMFPCTALMYWLGTETILELRDAVRAKRGAAFSMREFHDELLGHGSIPVPLIARMMV